ncbi:MAG: DUF4294 domain-containing protein [Bacteroidetes bacterium]|nr:DUF4294 domain-containing protein [Bacteroidota bacterium]
MNFRALHIPVLKLVCITGIFLCLQQRANAQYGQYDTIVREAVIFNGDTIESKTLGNFYTYAHMTEAQKAARNEYNRLRNAVYVTYPYARRAGVVMNDINAKLEHISGKSERKSYIRSREKELRKEFTKPLTDLSIYQGKVLMKLINRETGNNCYEIIKEYQGGLTARLYQTVAFFFSTSLKQPYDAANDDATIEKFVQEVQRMYGFQDIRKKQTM